MSQIFIKPELKKSLHYSKYLTFDLLIRSILRRASLLAQVHCGHTWEIDFGAIITRAREEVEIANNNLHWYDWERYSNRQHQRMPFGGFVDQISYTGNITEFLTLLGLGQYIHVGGKTSFGMGKYELIERENS